MADEGMNPDNYKFWTVDEIAAKFRISRMSVYRYIDSHQLRARRIGKQIRVEDADLNDFIKRSIVKPSADDTKE